MKKCYVREKLQKRRGKKFTRDSYNSITKSQEVAVLKEKALSLCQNLLTTVLDYKGERMEIYFGKHSASFLRGKFPLKNINNMEEDERNDNLIEDEEIIVTFTRRLMLYFL